MPRRQPPAAFTLIEIILALVILGGALAVLGEVIQRAGKNAGDARAETQAQILAESVLDEILAGSIDASQASRQPLEVDDSVKWLYSVAVGDTEYEGVIPMEVTVEQDLEARLEPVKYRLMRWIPSVEETDEGEEATANSQSSSQAGASGASSSSGSGGTL
jgi:prepilin-type N-terminal cleavage/methylation domain-containing protein